MFIITNSKVILPDKVITGMDVWIDEDRIVDIKKASDIYASSDQVIDAEGGYLAPGFIDIHSDYIEYITSPRPTVIMDFNMALREAERELVTHGVTTMFHSLSFYKEDEVYSKPIRQKDNVEKLVKIISGAKHNEHLIRHRFHARLELDNINSLSQIKDYIDKGMINLLSFMDHTPGQGQYSDLEHYRDMSRGYGKEFSDEEFKDTLAYRQSLPKISLKMCQELSQLAKNKGIAVASHDDDSIEKVEMTKKMGATISEFPITLGVAKYAHDSGIHTSAGAPNVLLGGSHSGNMAAHEAIANGHIDILCSDYYPPALLHSVFKLTHIYGHDLHEMIKLVTLNPAKAVNMEEDYGSITIGKKADLIIIKLIDNGFPVITSCFIDGKHAFETRYRS